VCLAAADANDVDPTKERASRRPLRRNVKTGTTSQSPHELMGLMGGVAQTNDFDTDVHPVMTDSVNPTHERMKPRSVKKRHVHTTPSVTDGGDFTDASNAHEIMVDTVNPTQERSKAHHVRRARSTLRPMVHNAEVSGADQYVADAVNPTQKMRRRAHRPKRYPTTPKPKAAHQIVPDVVNPINNRRKRPTKGWQADAADVADVVDERRKRPPHGFQADAADVADAVDERRKRPSKGWQADAADVVDVVDERRKRPPHGFQADAADVADAVDERRKRPPHGFQADAADVADAVDPTHERIRVRRQRRNPRTTPKPQAEHEYFADKSAVHQIVADAVNPTHAKLRRRPPRRTTTGAPKKILISRLFEIVPFIDGGESWLPGLFAGIAFAVVAGGCGYFFLRRTRASRSIYIQDSESLVRSALE